MLQKMYICRLYRELKIMADICAAASVKRMPVRTHGLEMVWKAGHISVCAVDFFYFVLTHISLKSN